MYTCETNCVTDVTVSVKHSGVTCNCYKCATTRLCVTLNVSARAKKQKQEDTITRPTRQGPSEGPHTNRPRAPRAPTELKYRASEGLLEGPYMAPRWSLELLSGTPGERPRARAVNFFLRNFFKPTLDHAVNGQNPNRYCTFSARILTVLYS